MGGGGPGKEGKPGIEGVVNAKRREKLDKERGTAGKEGMAETEGGGGGRERREGWDRGRGKLIQTKQHRKVDVQGKKEICPIKGQKCQKTNERQTTDGQDDRQTKQST
jgi:hypothetical protein